MQYVIRFLSCRAFDTSFFYLSLKALHSVLLIIIITSLSYMPLCFPLIDTLLGRSLLCLRTFLGLYTYIFCCCYCDILHVTSNVIHVCRSLGSICLQNLDSLLLFSAPRAPVPHLPLDSRYTLRLVCFSVFFYVLAVTLLSLM